MRNPFAPMDPERFDLTIASAARLLQSWALLSLSRIFDTPLEAPPPRWSDYVALRQLFAPPADNALTRWAARRQWRRWSTTPAAQQKLPRYIEDFALRSSWLGESSAVVRSWPGRLLGLPRRARRWPSGAAQAAGERAWTSPAFRFACHDIIMDSLRRTVVFDPDRVPVIRLHPNTLWLMLATEPRNALLRSLTLGGAGPRLSRLSLASDLAATRRLRDSMAATAGAGWHWAGFWDQWLLLQAWSACRAERLEITPRAATVIRGLPLLRDPSAVAVLTASGFVNALDRFGEAPAIKTAFEPARLGWEAERPGSFHRGLIISSRKERS